MKAPDGGSVFDVKVEFSEAAKTSNWGAWKSFVLPPDARPGSYSFSVEVQNRQTGERGSATGSFLVASGATALPADIRGEDWPDLQAELSSPLTPVMEEAVALLRLKRFDEAVRAFRKALDQEPESTLGYYGLAKAYEGLGAFKNVIETCEKAITCAKEPRAQAYMLNMKGVALSSRANRKQPPDKQDLVLAEQAYRAALDLNPALHLTRYNLGIMHVKAGEDAEGVELLRAYVAAAPKGPYVSNAKLYIDNPRRARENYAPDFSVVTSEGEMLDLAGLKGKVVVLDFWASWCAPCKETIPTLRRTAQRHANAPFVLISISTHRDAGAWRSAVAVDKMIWPQHLDSSGTLARLFKVTALPTTVILDGEGIIRIRLEGYSDSFGSTVDGGVRKWLKALTAPERQ